MQYSNATHHTKEGYLKKKKNGKGNKDFSCYIAHCIFISQRSLMFSLLRRNALQITVVQVERSVLEIISLHFELFPAEKYNL